MAKFSIGDRVFSSKKEAREVVRKVLNYYALGQEVDDPEDAGLIYDLLMMHPSVGVKVGPGVLSLWVRNNPDFGTRSFWVTRVDGTSTDFSLDECLKPAGKKQKALAGFRTAVRGQIIEFKAKAFENGDVVRCAVTGESVTRETCHVDHEIPFAVLLRDFLSEEGLKIDDVEVAPSGDGETTIFLADDNLAFWWAYYHMMEAKLRIVTREANLKRK